MMQNNSPAVTGLFAGFPTDSYQVAFQANSGRLWLVGTAATGDTGYAMAAGTSPSIAAAASGGSCDDLIICGAKLEEARLRLRQRLRDESPLAKKGSIRRVAHFSMRHSDDTSSNRMEAMACPRHQHYTT